MRELTRDMIQKYKDEFQESDRELAERCKTNSISNIAFNEEAAKAHKFEFSIDISTMNAVSQGYAGRCWIVAGLNLLREFAIRKMDRDALPEGNFLFSAGYLCFWDKVEKANCFLEKMIQSRSEPYHQLHSWFQYAITDGGFWTSFTDLVKKYGLVPSSVMPETFHSANTEEMNNRLNDYIRKVSADIRNAHSNGKGADEICRIKETAMSKIFTFLCRCYGCPPDHFRHSYTDKDGNVREDTYTPNSFCEELIGNFLEEFVHVISLPYEKLPFGEMCTLRDAFRIVGMNEEVFLNLPMEALKACCIAQLRDGIPIVCTADDDKMCRDELQLWDDKCFDYEAVTGFSFDMNRRDRFQLKAVTACHCMLITGVHIGENGEPQRWKIENSYGIDGLNSGYFTCSDSWFDQYVFSAVICKKYLSGYERSESDRNSFDIWDIM